MIIRVDHDGLALSVFVDQVARNTGNFCKYQCAGHPGNVDLALGIRIIDPIGRELAADVVHHLPIRKGDFEAYTFQGSPPVQAAEFIERNGTLRLVAELQGDGLPRLDGSSLGHIIQDIVLPGLGLARDQCGAGGDIGDQNGPGAVRHKFTVGITQHRAVAVGNKKFAVT